MTPRNHLRTLVPIMMLALAAPVAAPQPATAEPKGKGPAGCVILGYEWTERGCEGCDDGAGHGVTPGTKATCTKKTNPPTSIPCTCNGRTGKWEEDQAALPQPAPRYKGPAAVPPRGYAPPPLPLPPGPAAPLPLRKAPGS